MKNRTAPPCYSNYPVLRNGDKQAEVLYLLASVILDVPSRRQYGISCGELLHVLLARCKVTLLNNDNK